MLSVMVDLDRDGLDDLLVPEFSEGLSFFRRLDRVANSWQEYTIPKPPNTGTPKGCNVGDIDLDGRPDIVMSFANAADPLSGMVWLSYLNSPMDPGWVDHEISGPAGEKFDIVALVDLDGDGDLDVLTTEEEAPPNSRGLGVIWYENPTIQPDTDRTAFPMPRTTARRPPMPARRTAMVTTLEMHAMRARTRWPDWWWMQPVVRCWPGRTSTATATWIRRTSATFRSA